MAGVRHLLISNPPHGDVDALEAAPNFGLTAAEVRMKANYGIPEIWFADEDESKLQEIAAALEAAGLNVILVVGSDLVEIPVQNPAESFAFTDEGLQVDLGDSERTLAYEAPIIVVFGRPHVELQEGRPAASSVASQLMSWGRGYRRSAPDGAPLDLGTASFLDLYVPSGEGLLRIAIVPEITSFLQLPDNHPHGLSAMQNLVAECENRFENAYFDRRLVDMTLRGLASVVTATVADDAPTRSGFSYSTQALNELLGLLSPDLKDAPQADLSSRLVYLTARSQVS